MQIAIIGTLALLPAAGLAVPDGSIADAAVERVRDALVAAGDLKAGAPPSAYVDRHFMQSVAK